MLQETVCVQRLKYRRKPHEKWEKIPSTIPIIKRRRFEKTPYVSYKF